MSLATIYNSKIKTGQERSQWQFAKVLLLSALFILCTEEVYAACSGQGRVRVIPPRMEMVFCDIAYVTQSNVAKGIASIAVIMLGINAMIGKVSWATALLIAVGIAVVFNANNILCSIVGMIGSCTVSPIN